LGLLGGKFVFVKLAQRTFSAYLPFSLMLMAFAIAEFSGSNITTKPLKSSLKLVERHFGQTFSFVTK
jgi:hypothetical protein